MKRRRVRTNRVNVLGGGYAVIGIVQRGLKTGLFLHRGREGCIGSVGAYDSFQRRRLARHVAALL